MTAEDLEILLRWMYGDPDYATRWLVRASADLRIADRKLRSWLTGHAPIPPRVAFILCVLAVAHSFLDGWQNPDHRQLGELELSPSTQATLVYLAGRLAPPTRY
jgi:hypothetical protein